jgi:hypothetical protein
MPAPHVFALAHTQLDDFVVSGKELGRSSKRKRQGNAIANEAGDITDNDNTDGEASVASQLNRISRETTAFTSLTAAEHQQLRTAGLQPGEETPQFPFPHKRPAARGYILRDVRKELEDLNPPIAHLDPNYYAPQPYKTNKGRTTLREQHVAVLTTLLHQMLQKGDYKRAGRTWALLLRSGNLTRNLRNRQGIMGMDLRTHERWGIGAELLMRTQRKMSGTLFMDDADGYLDYSDEGFALARQYYERLAVQYPADIRSKGAQASTFFAAMFSLWIFEINEWNKAGVRSPRLRSVSRDPTPSEGSSSPTPKRTSTTDVEDDDIAQVRDAEAIAKRIDEVLENPPFDKNPELLHMRGMVEIWIADLRGPDAVDHTQRMEKAARCLSGAQHNGMELNEQALEVIREYSDENTSDDEIVEEEKAEGA